MSEQLKEDFDIKLILVKRDGQWSVKKLEIKEGSLPLIVPDVERIRRVVKIEQRKRMSELRLTQKQEGTEKETERMYGRATK